MALSQLNHRITHWLQNRFGRAMPEVTPPTRGATIHVVILDGTMSTLEDGKETNAGLTYKMLCAMGGSVSVYYEHGLQWSHWRRVGDVILGRGINRQIRRAYGYLASRYRPGDKIFLMGYSRGAYAVRSLAGVIDQIGLLKSDQATVRNIRDVYRHYETKPISDVAVQFSNLHCHEHVEIEMIGVWDTVKSLGINAPLLWRLSAPRHAFHNHALGKSVKHGYHALARHETRNAYAPVMWESDANWPGHVEQMWFRGTHGDVGGQVGDMGDSRPLANIPLVWMLEKSEGLGLPLPADWRGRFPQDARAPSVGTWSGFGALFISRRARQAGVDASERVHPSVRTSQARSRPWAWPGFMAVFRRRNHQ